MSLAGPSVRSFAPVFRADAQVLILGSMPGDASLTAGQYYAHPRNAFWPIMDRLFATGAAAPYTERIERLLHARIALWDVIGTCRRTGSLDSAIEADSIEANDLVGLLSACPALSHVFFNGSAAETAFRRHVHLPAGSRQLNFERLPSTSPAHASRSFHDKLAAWQIVRRAATHASPAA